jgi:RNA polymerase sigma-70 factor (ECF subfamily)
MGMGVLALDDEAIERIEASAGSGDGALTLLEELPEEQREAILARVVGERAYEDIAGELQCSPSVVRKRVTRGLAAMRNRMKERP